MVLKYQQAPKNTREIAQRLSLHPVVAHVFMRTSTAAEGGSGDVGQELRFSAARYHDYTYYTQKRTRASSCIACLSDLVFCRLRSHNIATGSIHPSLELEL